MKKYIVAEVFNYQIREVSEFTVYGPGRDSDGVVYYDFKDKNKDKNYIILDEELFETLEEAQEAQHNILDNLKRDYKRITNLIVKIKQDRNRKAGR